MCVQLKLINATNATERIFTTWIYLIPPFPLILEHRNYISRVRGIFGERSCLPLCEKSAGCTITTRKKLGRTKRIISVRDAFVSDFFARPRRFVSHRFALLSSLIRERERGRLLSQLAGKGLPRQKRREREREGRPGFETVHQITLIK